MNIIKKLEHKWMWLEQQHTEMKRDLVRKKSEDGRRTIGSRRGKKDPVILSVDAERIRAETSCFTGYRAGHIPSNTQQGF